MTEDGLVVEDKEHFGRLVLVPTPIGNLADITERATLALTQADVIACEDTRHTRQLLSASGITGKRLIAVHDHNERVAADGIVKLLLDGQLVAFVTDAGTPAISDPGSVVVRAVIDANLCVECLPGPTAFVVALAISGLPTERFVFEGFLPTKGSDRAELLREIADERRTVILYEAPHRVDRTLADLEAHCGSARRVSVSRELTKRFETTVRSTLGSIARDLGQSERRGEYVVVVEGRSDKTDSGPTDEELRERLNELRSLGERTRDAVDRVVSETGAARKRVYNLGIGAVGNGVVGNEGAGKGT